MQNGFCHYHKNVCYIIQQKFSACTIVASCPRKTCMSCARSWIIIKSRNEKSFRDRRISNSIGIRNLVSSCVELRHAAAKRFQTILGIAGPSRDTVDSATGQHLREIEMDFQAVRYKWRWLHHQERVGRSSDGSSRAHG